MIGSGIVSAFDAINPKILSPKIQCFISLVPIFCCIFWAGLLQYYMYYSQMAEPYTIRISSYFAFSLWEMKCTAWKTLLIFYFKLLILKIRACNRADIRGVSVNYSPKIIWFYSREPTSPRSMNIDDPLTRQMSMERVLHIPLSRWPWFRYIVLIIPIIIMFELCLSDYHCIHWNH